MPRRNNATHGKNHQPGISQDSLCSAVMAKAATTYRIGTNSANGNARRTPSRDTEGPPRPFPQWNFSRKRSLNRATTTQTDKKRKNRPNRPCNTKSVTVGDELLLLPKGAIRVTTPNV